VRSCVTNVDFPEPEGAEIIKSMPAIRKLHLVDPVFVRYVHYFLLQILNLLPSFLDLCLHLQPQLGNP